MNFLNKGFIIAASFKNDVYRRFGKYKITFKELFLNRDLRCLKAYRKANYFYNKKIGSRNLIYLFLYFYFSTKLAIYSTKYDFNIPGKTSICEGLFIGHNGPITINPNAIIGSNCNIGIGVTIGQENRGKRKGCPIIGDKVWIGTNAVVVGKIKIGSNVLIAPNSYVNFNVPDNSIVIGNSGRIIQNEHAVDEYINNTIDLCEEV